MSATPIYFAPLRVPLIDASTGLMKREWYLFFQALFLRIGGTSAPTNDDLAISAPPSNVMPDVVALQNALLDLTGQGPPPLLPLDAVDPLNAQLQEARELITTLQSTIQDLRQSPVVL